MSDPTAATTSGRLWLSTDPEAEASSSVISFTRERILPWRARSYDTLAADMVGRIMSIDNRMREVSDCRYSGSSGVRSRNGSAVTTVNKINFLVNDNDEI